MITRIRDHKAAFDHAIDTGALSADPSAEHYAGHWMYMATTTPEGTGVEVDLFKNIDSRRYIEVPTAGNGVVIMASV